MVTIGKEPHDGPINIKAGFAANGEYLVSGDEEGVRVWRVEDGRQLATMTADLVRCLAVSQDGRWIAVGISRSGVILLNAKTFESVSTHWETANYVIAGVDFSPDSTRFIVASSDSTTTVWDVATCERVLILHHEDRMIVAKYSPQGDRIYDLGACGSGQLDLSEVALDAQDASAREGRSISNSSFMDTLVWTAVEDTGEDRAVFRDGVSPSVILPVPHQRPRKHERGDSSLACQWGIHLADALL
jgi:WD40 repeat protein